MKHSFVVKFDERHNITMTTFKDFVNIHIHAQDLENSAGLMGDYKTGASVGRDRSTLFEDPVAFGQEWQVLETEPMLFAAARAPQAPLEKCRMPKQGAANKNVILYDAAVKVCREHAHQNVDSCIADIMVTEDLELIESGAF